MDKKIKKILACIDLSDYTRMVLNYAVEVAGPSQIHILVYNVINQREVSRVESISKFAPGKIGVKDYIKRLKKDREGKIKALLKAQFFENTSHMSFKVDVGIPSGAILETIETQGIDLVVMANKGRGNMSRFLFGSAAEKVFRHSPVPVFSVRGGEQFKRGN